MMKQLTLTMLAAVTIGCEAATDRSNELAELKALNQKLSVDLSQSILDATKKLDGKVQDAERRLEEKFDGKIKDAERRLDDAAKHEEIQDTVRARRFVIVDDNGKPGGGWTAKDGILSQAFAITDERGKLLGTWERSGDGIVTFATGGGDLTEGIVTIVSGKKGATMNFTFNKQQKALIGATRSGGLVVAEDLIKLPAEEQAKAYKE